MMLNEPIAASFRKGPPRPQDAIAPIPASVDAYDMADEDDIGDTLTLLASSGEPISMYAAGSREPVLGRIFSVDPEQPHFVMELNEGASLRSGDITFVACLRSAKLQFRLSSPAWKSAPGQPQMIPMTFPETCSVLNRRSSERVEAPLGVNFIASFALGGTNGATSSKLLMHDFSLGGIGLRCAKRDAQGLFKGRKLQDVLLELGSESVMVKELEIRVRRAFRSFLLGEQFYIGCMFTEIAPEEASKIQNYLNQLATAPRLR